MIQYMPELLFIFIDHHDSTILHDTVHARTPFHLHWSSWLNHLTWYSTCQNSYSSSLIIMTQPSYMIQYMQELLFIFIDHHDSAILHDTVHARTPFHLHWSSWLNHLTWHSTCKNSFLYSLISQPFSDVLAALPGNMRRWGLVSNLDLRWRSGPARMF